MTWTRYSWCCDTYMWLHKEKKNIRSGNKILGVRRRNKRPQFSCLSDAEADHLSNKCLPLSVWNIICWCWHVRAALLCPCWLCAAPLPPQAALKKYQMEHKSKGESLEKCQAELKKLRRKSQGSKHPSKYGDKEMQVSVWVCVSVNVNVCSFFSGSIKKKADVYGSPVSVWLSAGPLLKKCMAAWLQMPVPKKCDPAGFRPACGADNLPVSFCWKCLFHIIHSIFISAVSKFETPTETFSELVLTFQSTTHSAPPGSQMLSLLLMGFEPQCA